MKCKICGHEDEDKLKFARHLQFSHKINSRDYTIKHIYDGLQPKCAICFKETRYVSFTFKRYCKEHSKYAEIEGGRQGGKAPAWNKGLTKDDDPRIARQAAAMTGSNNHFYGKTHSEETRAGQSYNIYRERVDILSKQIKDKYRIGEFNYQSQNQKLTITHLECGTVFTPTIRNFLSGSRCPMCARLNIVRRPHAPHRIFDFIRDNDYELMDEDFEFQRLSQRVKVKHTPCGFVWEPIINNLFQGLTTCPKCKSGSPSQPEFEIVEYLKSIGITNIVQNDRTIIAPKELDIWLPDHKLGIEYNGLYWHTAPRVGRRAHLDKTKACLNADARLFHVFSDEWLNKTAIVKSMIAHRLNASSHHIGARKCDVVVLKSSASRAFFDQAHISGFVGARAHFGLVYEGRVVAALSLRAPIQKKHGHVLEIARFATALNTSVVGGFSRLLGHAIDYARSNEYDAIISYVDRRFGSGRSYAKLGFEDLGSTDLDYWYTDGSTREFRFKYRAQNGLTEAAYAASQGVERIYGCGSQIFKLAV